MKNFFNGMFGKIEAGLCRLSMNGDISIKTSDGYKAYNVETSRLINCDNFAFDIGEDFFFCIPTNKVEVGDIILVNHKPKCVREVKENSIIVIDYEDSTIKEILPERHIFMGNTFFYGKIVSMFGNSNFIKGKDGFGKMMKFMMMSQMLNGSNPLGGMGNNNMAMLMMMNGGFGDMFDNMFDMGGFMEEDKEDE